MTYTERTSLRQRPAHTASPPDSVATLFSDIPDGMTIAEYRRLRAAAAPKGWRRWRLPSLTPRWA